MISVLITLAQFQAVWRDLSFRSPAALTALLVFVGTLVFRRISPLLPHLSRKELR
jgi:hypothetical protein